MDNGKLKNQPPQIILDIYRSNALNFNGILTIDDFEIQSNDDWCFDAYKIGHRAGSWDGKSVSEGGPSETHWAG